MFGKETNRETKKCLRTVFLHHRAGIPEMYFKGRLAWAVAPASRHVSSYTVHGENGSKCFSSSVSKTSPTEMLRQY